MKKLFSIFTALMFVIALSACTEDLQPKVTELETKVTELEASLEALQNEKAGLETDKSDLSVSVSSLEETIENLNTAITNKNDEISDLQNQIKDLQDQLFDSVITISVTTLDGSIKTSTLGVNDDYEGTLFDLLNASFEVEATLGQYGHFITKLEDLEPLNGAYISFTKNGEMAMLGVDSIPFSDGDTFAFELVWWDTTEEAVYHAIDLFLENHAADYVNETSIDYNVISALSILGVEEEYVTDEQVQAYVDGLTLTTGNDYFKAITILEAAGLDATTLYQELNTIAAVGGFGATGYQLTAFSSNGTTVDYSTFENAALTDLSNNTPLSLGVNSGAISVIALSNYLEEDGVPALISEWVSYIKTNQLDTGAVTDIDFGWGQTEDASTMSQAVLGLIAVGVNPKGNDQTGTDMTQLNYNLISELLTYQTETGSFNWTNTEDLLFSTPQAFLAIVSYQEFSNNYSPVNPYSFQ